MNKTLVAYFSCTGTTENVAKKLADVVNADLYKIEPLTPYTDNDLDWNNNQSRSSIEMSNKTFRPKISGKCENINDYSIIYIGFPIWWYVAPTIINTFLESYDFSGKTIVPFATSGSSDVGNTDDELHGSCSKNTKWKPAKRFPANVSDNDLKKWVNSLEL